MGTISQDKKMGKLVSRKRKSRRSREEPAKVLPKRVKGNRLAYLLVLEKGGTKRHFEQMETKKVEEPTITLSNEKIKKTGKPKWNTALLMEPFENGWRREVVYRATVDPGTKTLCDIYYYAPDGKKLRSGREVAMHLEKLSSRLSIANFTFFKEAIGIDTNQELVRYAKKRGANDVKEGVERVKKEPKQATKTAFRKKEPVVKNAKANEDLIRNLQELGGIIAEALETAKCVPVGGRRQVRQGTGNVMVQALAAQTFQTRALLAQTFQSRSHKSRTS